MSCAASSSAERVYLVSIIQRIRAYHAVLGVLVIVAYLTGEAGLVHALLGYAIAVLILGRIAAALTGLPALGLSRFYPQFEGLRLGTAFTHPAISKTLLAGIAACLIGATVTGIALDRGQSIGVTGNPIVSVAQADDDGGKRGRGEPAGRGETGEEGPLGEVHEALSTLLMVLVGMHIAYLLLFKRSLARFMLFLSAPKAGVEKGERTT
jgi:cytochrome b